MSSQTTDIVSNGDVDFYFTGVQQAYLRALKGNNRALYPKFAFVPPATGMTTSKFPLTERRVGVITERQFCTRNIRCVTRTT
jgi:hypothetical protein